MVKPIQKKGLPFLLVFTGLPTLFPKLVEARTFTERMFHVVTLGRLNKDECRQAITIPVMERNCPVTITEPTIEAITRSSGGYPYFVRFLCREIYDSYLQQKASGILDPVVTVAQVVRKLDSDFFAGRWNRVTDRQRELLSIVAMLPNCDDEFALNGIVAKSQESGMKPFSSSHVNQMLATLSESGLVYKNRYGKYAFAVPLLGAFIRRQQATLN